MIKKEIAKFVIDDVFQDIFNLYIKRLHPKESIKFASDYFKKRKIIAVEIGVFKGINSREIIKNLNIKKLFLIDPYLRYEEYKNDKTSLKVFEAKREAHKRLKKDYRKIIWVEDFSEKATKRISEKVDFIYIDGNHDYPYVKRDIELYWNKIKEGGIMAGHDIDGEGVSKAVIEFIEKNKISPDKVYFGNKTDWWIIKEYKRKNG